MKKKSRAEAFVLNEYLCDMAVTPYNDTQSGKKEQVENMFDRIAFRYDLLNRVLSLGIDQSWRRKAIRKLNNPATILDVATGTGDVAIMEASIFPNSTITGLDLSQNMLDLAKEKVLAKKLVNRVQLIKGDSEALPFPDNQFDGVTVAFGARNFENLEAGLREMYRVVKPGGKVVVLEFSMPRRFPVKQFYSFYFKRVLPKMGAVVSGDKRAYTYLPESVNAFPSGDDFTDIMKKCGYKDTATEPLMFGIASIYTGIK